ncbi:hypothetical protein F8M41_024606 [Gigaspora margarita]|uniref:Uncharacterized protein n=1 Tax=Gigaspora margarita TaxID=4874 RepID=A0A8H4ABF4_GIGMA|nr:hypothetical protein F8M41_024606 [Gigaspora margarita]
MTQSISIGNGLKTPKEKSKAMSYTKPPLPASLRLVFQGRLSSLVQTTIITSSISHLSNMVASSIFMRNTAGDTSSEMILQKYYPSQPQTYVSKLNWYDYAVNELFIIVFPSGLGEDLPVTAHWQWTKNLSGEQKANRDLSDKQHKNNQNPTSFHFGDGYYTFNCKADDKNKTLAVTMKNPSGDSFGTVMLQLQSNQDM